MALRRRFLPVFKKHAPRGKPRFAKPLQGHFGPAAKHSQKHKNRPKIGRFSHFNPSAEMHPFSLFSASKAPQKWLCDAICRKKQLFAGSFGSRSHSFCSFTLVFTEGWKEVGYNTVIYLAAITGIDITLYEAARVDGASKWRQIWNITMPGLLPTIVLMLILKVGYILETGFEQVLVFYNPAVYEVADIIQTYVYRLGMGQMDFPLSTALGLFNSVVAFVLIVSANAISRKLLGRSIW